MITIILCMIGFVILTAVMTIVAIRIIDMIQRIKTKRLEKKVCEQIRTGFVKW